MRQLTEVFAIAARQYAEIAVRFGATGPDEPDFARLVQITEEARQESEAAFKALQRHAGVHRCVPAARMAAGGS